MYPYQIIRTKRRTLAIVIERDGSLVVRAPMRATQAQIEEALREKEGWIREKQELNRAAWKRQRPMVFREGEEFLFLGKAYRLRIVERQRARLVFKEGFWLSASAVKNAKAVFEQWYREQARQVLTERVQYYTQKHGLRYRSLRISGARTRWGSCGANGSLNFSWRLAMAPVEVIDYVVIHELAHLEEKSHSRRYWEKVERLMPDYRSRRQWLKKNGESLHL